MRKIYAALIAVAMLSIFTPGVSASFTDTAFYDVPSGPVHLVAGDRSVQPALSTRLCAPEWDEWDEGALSDSGDELVFGNSSDNPDDTAGEAVVTPAFSTGCGTGREARFGDRDSDNGVVNMGVFSRAIQSPSDDYTNFAATVQDNAFDSTFFTICIITDHSDGGEDNTCGDETQATGEPTDTNTEDFPQSGCGSNTVDTDGVLAGHDNRVANFIYGVHLDSADLEPCFGSSGKLTVVMT